MESTETAIPPKDRPEWEMILTGKIKHQYRNYVLQITIYQLSKNITEGRCTVQEAVEDLRELCQKYSKAVQGDFRQIFKNW